jgi:hypothetical protein
MSETTLIILGLVFAVLQGFTVWRFTKTLDKMEQLFQARWQRMTSVLSGDKDHVQFQGLDPKAENFAEQAQAQGLR